MPDRFVSGETSDRFEPIVGSRVIARLNAVEEMASKVLEQCAESTQETNDETREKIDLLERRVRCIHEQFDNVNEAVWRVLNSRLFRFLNALGGWYITASAVKLSMDELGNFHRTVVYAVYPPEEKYEEYGTLPWILRVKRRLKDMKSYFCTRRKTSI